MSTANGYLREVGTTITEEKRYKAHLALKGCIQKEGVNFNEIFSNIVRHTSIQVLLAMVARQDLELEQLDMKTTFLYRELEEDILMCQPEGSVVSGKNDQVSSCKNSYMG